MKKPKSKSDSLKAKAIKDKRKIKKIRNCCKKQYSSNDLGIIRFANKRYFWKERFQFFLKNV